MSQWDRHAAGGASTAAQPSDPPAGGARASREAGGSPNGAWEDYFSALPAADQQRLLALASQQGFVRAGQLPPAPAANADAFRRLLDRLRSDDGLAALPPIAFVDPLDIFDADLDGPQSDAAARALQTPDLLLIQGLPGTGKTRTIAEIVRQATARGMRVLLTAPNGAAVDAVLTRLENAERLAVRCLARNESIEDLPSAAARLIRAARESSLREEWLRQARANEQHLEAEMGRLLVQAPVWAGLLELAEEQRCLDQNRELLHQQRDALLAQVRVAAEAGAASAKAPFVETIQAAEREQAEHLAVLEAEGVELQKQRARRDGELAGVHARREALRPQEEALRRGRFWTWTYWQARFNMGLPAKVAEAQAQLDAAEMALAELAHWHQLLRDKRARVERDFAAARDRLIDAEVERRATEIDQHTAAFRATGAALQQRFHDLCGELPAGIAAPAALTTAAVRTAQEAAAARQLDREQAWQFARRWREFVEKDTEVLLRRWRETVPVVAAPLAAVAADSWLNGPEIASFDMVIVDDAHLMAEADLPPAARRAKRWIFVGQPAQPAPSIHPSRRHSSRNHDSRRLAKPTNFFNRLWDRLNHETWAREAGRLCCRLLPVADRRRLESETVADRPEVELRILTAPSGDPALAEVLFPAAMPVGEAAEFLFHELGEVPCASRTRTSRWSSAADSLIFGPHAASVAALQSSFVTLGDGVTLQVSEPQPGSPEVAVAFSNLNGWDRKKSEEWVTRHLALRDAGRTCQLEQSYRHTPALAAWLNEALHQSARYALEQQRTDGAVQFEPVPRRTPAGGHRRGGAGFEIDLGDPRQRELLPAELAAVLPAHGCVNLPEAQAVADLIRRLPSGHSVAVTAPYPAQVALLACLCKGPAPVVHPAALTHREFEVLVVSLTRSHVSRAVTYGDEPAIVPGLLCQPRCRLIVVGDPGTLARRAQWEGAIDHLDAADGERERRWVNAVLKFVPSRPPVVRVPQGVKA